MVHGLHGLFCGWVDPDLLYDDAVTGHEPQ